MDNAVQVLIGGELLSEERQKALKNIIHQQYLSWHYHLMFGQGGSYGDQVPPMLPEQQDYDAWLSSAELLKMIDPEFPFKDSVSFENGKAVGNITLAEIRSHWETHGWNKPSSERNVGYGYFKRTP